MPRQLLISVAAGLLAAVLYLSTGWSMMGAIVLALAAPLPIFAAGLGLGLASALTSTAVALAAVSVAAGFGRAGLFLLVDALPALLVVRFALLNRTEDDGTVEWYPPGLMLTWLSLYCAAAFLGLALVVGTGPSGLEAGISAYVEGFRQVVSGASQDSAAVERMFEALKRVFPFLVTAWWIVIMAVNGVLAQRLLVRFGVAMRPTPAYSGVALPSWLLPVVVAAVVVALLGSGWLGFLATNVALILCVPFFLVGLAVVHAVSLGWNGRTAILIAVYLLLVLFRWPLIVIAGLGMVDHWLGLRRRFGGPSQGNERNE